MLILVGEVRFKTGSSKMSILFRKSENSAAARKEKLQRELARTWNQYFDNPRCNWMNIFRAANFLRDGVTSPFFVSQVKVRNMKDLKSLVVEKFGRSHFVWHFMSSQLTTDKRNISQERKTALILKGKQSLPYNQYISWRGLVNRNIKFQYLWWQNKRNHFNARTSGKCNFAIESEFKNFKLLTEQSYFSDKSFVWYLTWRLKKIYANVRRWLAFDHKI